MAKALLLAIIVSLLFAVGGTFLISKRKVDISSELSSISFVCNGIMFSIWFAFGIIMTNLKKTQAMLQEVQELHIQNNSSLWKQSSSFCTSSHKEDTQQQDTITFPLPFQSK